MNLKERAIELADTALNNPELVKKMDNDKFFTFVLCIAKHDKKRAIAVEMLKPFTTSQNKILFWEAVGVLASQECDDEMKGYKDPFVIDPEY
jgi:hypothetical protein